VNAGELPVVGGEDGAVDGDRRGEGKKRTSTAHLQMSWRGCWTRPEVGTTSVRSRRSTSGRSALPERGRRGQGGAYDRKEEIGTKKWSPGHLGWPESRKHGGGNAELRRAIPSAWGDLSEGKEGKMERGNAGHLKAIIFGL
jgi:hypothetical protein